MARNVNRVRGWAIWQSMVGRAGPVSDGTVYWLIMVTRRTTKPARRPRRKPDGAVRPGESFSEQLLALARRVPKAEWEKLPRDGAANIDHYLYGAAKDET